MSINFTARLVDSPKIQQRKSLFKYDAQNASIVELDLKNKSDMIALNKASTSWMENGGKYASSIFFEAAYSGSDKFYRKQNHFYALTTQNQNFQELKPENILGLMMFQEVKGAPNEISLLEVNPKTSMSCSFFRKYKQVGKKLVEFVQENFFQKDIQVWADYYAINFYKKSGFKKNSKEPCDLLWKAVK